MQMASCHQIFQPETCVHMSSMHPTCFTYVTLVHFIIQIKFGGEYVLLLLLHIQLSPMTCSFLPSKTECVSRICLISVVAFILGTNLTNV